jgi:hypothetical protein
MKTANCYAVELYEMWEIVNEITMILSDCQVFIFSAFKDLD